MKTGNILLLILILTTPVFSASLPPRIILELSDTAAEDALILKELPVSMENLLCRNLSLEPVFYEPVERKNHDLWIEHGLNRWFRVEGVFNPEDLFSQITLDQDILQKDLQYPIQPYVIPNDYIFHNLWALETMNLPDAWDIHHGDSSVLIATIDSGCDIFHPDLEANIWINPGEDLNNNGIWDENDNNGIDDDHNGFIDDLCGWDFVSPTAAQIPQNITIAPDEDLGPRDNLVYPDFYGHGTHVSGIAAGVTHNNQGISSASWNVKNMPLKIMFAVLQNGNISTQTYLDDAAPAIQYAADNGARIINMSWGESSERGIWRTALNYAEAQDVLLIAAAGNNDSQDINYPAGYDNVIAVAGTDEDDLKTSSSSYGSWITLCAPGENIWSTMSNNQYHSVDYASWTGTSMAAPMVTSVAALILNYAPFLSAEQLEDILFFSCDNIYTVNPDYIGLLGIGRLNAATAMLMAEQAIVEGEKPLPDSPFINAIYPNPFNPDTRIEIQVSQSSHLKIQVFNLLGEEVELLADAVFSAGKHTINLNASELSSGVYLVNVLSNGIMNDQRKIVLLK